MYRLLTRIPYGELMSQMPSKLLRGGRGGPFGYREGGGVWCAIDGGGVRRTGPGAFAFAFVLL